MRLLLFAVLAAAEPSWKGLPYNAADAPGRCSADKVEVRPHPFVLESYARDEAEPASVEAQIQALLRANVRTSPWPLVYFSKTSRYYERRGELQGLLEAAARALPESERADAWGNYAMALLYLGEFEKVARFFRPAGRPYKEAARRGVVDFALSQALYRLGRNKASLEHAGRAYRLLEDAVFDTRWQAMLAASAELGPRFFTQPSDMYTAKHARELFPADKWELPFEDATKDYPLDRWGGFGSAVFADFDGDGWDDLLFERKYFPLKAYRNMEGKGFELMTRAEPGLNAAPCNSVLSFPADYDNDGRPDVLRNCCNFEGVGRPSLARNLGDWSFVDVSSAAAVDAPIAGGTTSCWGDYDLDGDVDAVLNGLRDPARLLRNLGNGRFEDATKRAGISTPGSLRSEYDFGGFGCSFADLNGDRWPDLFLQGWAWRRLYLNDGKGGFADATEASGVGAGLENKGYMSSIIDFDNDGRLDILAGSYVVASNDRFGIGPTCLCSNLLSPDGFSDAEWRAATTIFRNNGDGTFTDQAPKLRFLPIGVMSMAHADWDNDGDEDIVMGAGGGYYQQIEPYLFYRNEGGTFTLKTPFLMQSLWGKGHGIAFSDWDRDGDLDLALNNGGATEGDVWPGFMFRNTGTKNRWLTVRLRPGPGTNRSAIGAIVTVEAGGRKQTKVVQSGGTFSAWSFSLHFGLGEAEKADSVRVEWPNRKLTRTVLTDVKAGQLLEISEEG